MTGVTDSVRQTRNALRAANIDSADLDARLLVEAASGLDRAAILAAPERELTFDQQTLLTQLIARRAGREPMAYILGRREFRSLEFLTAPGVLIPRPDTETLIEAVLKNAPDAKSILDFGTGSGCILLSLLHAMPNARGVGVDQSKAALDIASENAKRLGLSDRASFIASDWGATVSGQFDLIVSNPPYIRAGDIGGLDLDVRNFEPISALDGGADGLEAYRALASQLHRFMTPGALAGFEIGWDQAAEVSSLLTKAGFISVEVHQDLAGRDRVVLARAG